MRSAPVIAWVPSKATDATRRRASSLTVKRSGGRELTMLAKPVAVRLLEDNRVADQLGERLGADPPRLTTPSGRANSGPPSDLSPALGSPACHCQASGLA